MKKSGGASPRGTSAPRTGKPAAAARASVLRVGLTGGIATGKSTVARYFENFGAAVLDADVVAHRLIEQNAPGYSPVVAAFGRGIVQGDGSIDRKALGRIVFADAEARKRLEAILHPLIQVEEDAFVTRLASGGPRILMINAALLFEAGTWKSYDRVVVVHCEESTQVARIVDRDRLSKEDATARIRAQMPTSEKVRQADYAIDTTDGLEATEDQAREVWRHLEAELANR
jgi:dephospho-CoA kinase